MASVSLGSLYTNTAGHRLLWASHRGHWNRLESRDRQPFTWTAGIVCHLQGVTVGVADSWKGSKSDMAVLSRGYGACAWC